jgi:hypothetical protein
MAAETCAQRARTKSPFAAAGSGCEVKGIEKTTDIRTSPYIFVQLRRLHDADCRSREMA